MEKNNNNDKIENDKIEAGTQREPVKKRETVNRGSPIKRDFFTVLKNFRDLAKA